MPFSTRISVDDWEWLHAQGIPKSQVVAALIADARKRGLTFEPAMAGIVEGKSE